MTRATSAGFTIMRKQAERLSWPVEAEDVRFIQNDNITTKSVADRLL
jgi:hypothetical protein